MSWIGGQPEEIALLLDPFDRRAVGAEPLSLVVEPGFALVVVGLVAHRVPAGILVEINVAVRLHPLPDRLRRAVVARLGGADEVVVRAIEHFHHGLEARHVALDQLARRQTLFACRLQHLHPVLVGAGEEEHVTAVKPHEAGDGVGGDRFVGVADMRRTVRVGNRGSDVVGLASHLILAPQLGALNGRRSPSGGASKDQRPGQARPRMGHRYQPLVASASKPKTLKTSGFRSRLYSVASRAA